MDKTLSGSLGYICVASYLLSSFLFILQLYIFGGQLMSADGVVTCIVTTGIFYLGIFKTRDLFGELEVEEFVVENDSPLRRRYG